MRYFKIGVMLGYMILVILFFMVNFVVDVMKLFF